MDTDTDEPTSSAPPVFEEGYLNTLERSIHLAQQDYKLALSRFENPQTVASDIQWREERIAQYQKELVELRAFAGRATVVAAWERVEKLTNERNQFSTKNAEALKARKLQPALDAVAKLKAQIAELELLVPADKLAAFKANGGKLQPPR